MNFGHQGRCPKRGALGRAVLVMHLPLKRRADTWLCPAAFWRPSRKPSSFPLGSLPSSLVPVHTARPLEAWRTQASAVSLFPGGSRAADSVVLPLRHIHARTSAAKSAPPVQFVCSLPYRRSAALQAQGLSN